MFIVDAMFGILAVIVVGAVHLWLVRRHLKAPFGDVRSGLFTAVAEWAAKKMDSLTGPRERTWKANILAPVEVSSQAGDYFELLRDIAYPKGFVRLLGLTGKRELEELQTNLPRLADRFEEEDIFSTWTIVDAADFGQNLAASLEALGGAFFRSNILFLRLPREGEREGELTNVIKHSAASGIGVLLHASPREKVPSRRDRAAVWLRKPAAGWELDSELGDMDLALLTGHKLKRNWGADLDVIARMEEGDDREEAEKFLKLVVELARIPNARTLTAVDGREAEAVGDSPPDLSVFPFVTQTGFNEMRRLSDQVGGVCLFALDSGEENVLV
jgi:hypothetical protein